MKAAIHYELRFKLVNYQTNDKIDFIDEKEVFEDENPIRARKKAIEKMDEWIKDLYSVKLNQNSDYLKDKQTRKDFTRFYPDDNHIAGIGVYMVIDEPYEESYEDSCNKQNEKIQNAENERKFITEFDDIENVDSSSFDEVDNLYFIHGYGYFADSNNPVEIAASLEIEFGYYRHYKYSTENFERTYKFYDYELGKVDTVDCLDTPFEWTGLDKPDPLILEKFLENKILSERLPDKYEKMIRGGEGKKVEFKPALCYNFKKRDPIFVKNIISKTICAFLNSKGGFLFIGLRDDGTTQGLEEYDFSLSKDRKPKDFFNKQLDSLISYYFGMSKKPLINADFFERDNKTICVLAISSSEEDVFKKGENGSKDFFIRGFGGNHQLKSDEEIKEYGNNKKNAESNELAMK